MVEILKENTHILADFIMVTSCTQQLIPGWTIEKTVHITFSLQQ